MFVLPLAGLSAARCFPKYQNAMSSGALVPYDSLDRNSAFVVFVSHRWVNESSRPTGFRQHGAAARDGDGAGDGTPDVDSAKHAFLVEGLTSILASLPREVAVFLWIDFSCIDQVREPRIIWRTCRGGFHRFVWFLNETKSGCRYNSSFVTHVTLYNTVLNHGDETRGNTTRTCLHLQGVALLKFACFSMEQHLYVGPPAFVLKHVTHGGTR